MNNPNLCPKCQSPLDSDALEGLCPRCLAALSLGADTVIEGEDHKAAAPPLSPEEIAPHFPQLEILSCLGRGGMGVVYKARQKSLNRLVALKLLAPERAGDIDFAGRFAKEAQALAALSHPNIVAIHDFGQAGGFFFLLMEFVDGVNLRQVLRTRRLTPKEALEIIPPICDALQCAHDHGIVHRDIKPENLLLNKSGRVKIADFGVAKMLGENVSASSAAACSGSAAPQHSVAVGTPDYAAPEQRDATATADHRADIYSLGVVLYEMLTGERPKGNIEPPSRRVQVDIRIDEIVLRALEAKPELRFATAADFRTQVEAAASSAPTLSRIQGIISAVAPARWLEIIRRESENWRCVCECGRSDSVWARGGIRFGGAGKPRKLMWCNTCEKLRWHSVEWRGPGAGEKTTDSHPSPAIGRSAAALAVMWWFATCPFIAYFSEAVGGRTTASITLTLLALAALIYAVLGRRKAMQWHSWEGGRVWLRGFSWLGWALTVPVIAIAGFVFYSLLSERGAWNPGDFEILTVSVIGASVALLPGAAVVLRQASSTERVRPMMPLAAAALALACAAGIGGAMTLAHRSRPNAIENKYVVPADAVVRSATSDTPLDAPNLPRVAYYEKAFRTQTELGASAKPGMVTRTFSLRHKLGSNIAEDLLHQIVSARSGQEARHSSSNQEVIITAPTDVMTRAQTFISVTDWPDSIRKIDGSAYLTDTVLRTARAFFHACAVEDPVETLTGLLSPHVLATLKGDTKSGQYFYYSTGGVPDADWEKSLRADWPGKTEAMQRFVREWNRYPLTRITEQSGIAMGFGVKYFCSVSFEGAPKEFYTITIEPGRTLKGTSRDSFFLSTLPPWWDRSTKSAEATRSTELEGEWSVVEQLLSGEERADSVGGRFRFSGNLLHRVAKDGTVRVNGFRLLQGNERREIDLLADESADSPTLERGIYRFDGEQLFIAFSRADAGRRPNGFVSMPGGGIEVTTLTRIPKGTK